MGSDGGKSRFEAAAELARLAAPALGLLELGIGDGPGILMSVPRMLRSAMPPADPRSHGDGPIAAALREIEEAAAGRAPSLAVFCEGGHAASLWRMAARELGKALGASCPPGAVRASRAAFTPSSDRMCDVISGIDRVSLRVRLDPAPRDEEGVLGDWARLIAQAYSGERICLAPELGGAWGGGELAQLAAYAEAACVAAAASPARAPGKGPSRV